MEEFICVLLAILPLMLIHLINSFTAWKSLNCFNLNLTVGLEMKKIKESCLLASIRHHYVHCSGDFEKVEYSNLLGVYY